MSIRMMVSKERAGLPNVETVHNYPGAESKFIAHNWNCPHQGNQLDTERHPDCHPDCKHREPLYIETSFVGCVLGVRERNGYDDSDFYALVWDESKGEAYEIEYATTRGWTYPNGATVDATPEVIEKYRIWLSNQYFTAYKTASAKGSVHPGPGKSCKVIRGRKFPIGLVCTIVRTEIHYYGRNSIMSALVSYPDATGRRTQGWVPNVENLEVINPSQYLHPDEVLLDRATEDANQMIALRFPKK